jgi:hypothetical protein
MKVTFFFIFCISFCFAMAQSTPQLGNSAIDSTVFLQNQQPGQQGPLPELKNFEKQFPAPKDVDPKKTPNPELAPMSKPKED